MFTKEDLAMHKGLVELLNKAEFPLKRRELRACDAVCNWVAILGDKIEKSIKEPAKKPPVSIKKTGTKK